MLAKDCLEEFRLECQLRRLSAKTIKGYYNNTMCFLVYTERISGVTELEELHPIHIRRYIQYLMGRNLSASYANGIIKCLRAFFKFAVLEGYLSVSPANRISWQKEGKVLIQAFTDEEVSAMMKVFDNSAFLSCRNKLILAIAFDTGARNTEICDILNGDVKENVLLIRGKGNKQRNVPLTPYVKRVMLKYQRLKDYYFRDKILRYDNYLLSRTGRPLTREALEHIFTQAGRKAGIRQEIRCSPHTARHYYAQANLRNGLDVYSLSRLLGHENINITKRYLQSIQDDSIIELATDKSPLANLHL